MIPRLFFWTRKTGEHLPLIIREMTSRLQIDNLGGGGNLKTGCGKLSPKCRPDALSRQLPPSPFETRCENALAS